MVVLDEATRGKPINPRKYSPSALLRRQNIMYNTFESTTVAAAAKRLPIMSGHSQSEFLDLEEGRRSTGGGSNHSNTTIKDLHTLSSQTPTLDRVSTQGSQVTVDTINSYISLPVKHPLEDPTSEDDRSQSSFNTLESQPSATPRTALASSLRSFRPDDLNSANTFIHHLDLSHQPTVADLRFEFLVRLILITFAISMFMFGTVIGLVFYRTRR